MVIEYDKRDFYWIQWICKVCRLVWNIKLFREIWEFWIKENKTKMYAQTQQNNDWTFYNFENVNKIKQTCIRKNNKIMI